MKRILFPLIFMLFTVNQVSASRQYLGARMHGIN